MLRDVTASWEPIISPDDHALLTAKFADPARRSWTDATAKHLLTGLARCGECGGEIRRISNRGCPSYACVGRRHQHTAGTRRFCVSRRMDYVDTFVTDVILARLGEPDLRNVFTVDSGDDVQAAQRELAELRAEHTELIALAERREVSVTAFARLEAALLPRIADAERRAQPVAVPPPYRACGRTGRRCPLGGARAGATPRGDPATRQRADFATARHGEGPQGVRPEPDQDRVAPAMDGPSVVTPGRSPASRAPRAQRTADMTPG